MRVVPENVLLILKSLPEKPGVYRFFGRDGENHLCGEGQAPQEACLFLLHQGTRFIEGTDAGDQDPRYTDHGGGHGMGGAAVGKQHDQAIQATV